MQNSQLLLLCWLTIKNQITEYEQFKRTLPVESIIVFSQIFFNKITRWCVFWQLLLLCWLTIKNQITEYEQFKRTLPVESIIVFSQIFFNKITKWCVFWQDFRPSFCVQFLDKENNSWRGK